MHTSTNFSPLLRCSGIHIMNESDEEVHHMTDQQQIDILRQGITTWNKWREELSAREKDNWNKWSDDTFKRVSFDDIDLRGADLRGAKLSRANLSRANLSGADLSDADLSATHLSATH